MENILQILHRFILSVDANYMRLFIFKHFKIKNAVSPLDLPYFKDVY